MTPELRSAVWRMLAAALAASIACASPTPGPASAGAEVSARADGVSGIRLRNETNRPIYYVAFERSYAARVQFAPCTDAPRCPSIAPNSEGTIPYSAIGGYEAGAREAVVYWWHLRPNPEEGERLLEDMHSVIVRF